jgi:hypothetical protein
MAASLKYAQYEHIWSLRKPAPKGRRFPELACIPFEQNRGVAECSTGDENIDLSS